MKDLYRLVYTSRNLLAGSEDEQKAAVAGLLAVSKRNNARVGVTGALLFNGGSFAQVLEGSRAAVETTFERIQRDPRHSDVAVLQCEPVEARGFPNWSMGFVGDSPRGRALWTEVARLTDFDLGRLEGNVLFNTLLSIVREEEGEAAPARPSPAPAGLDVARLRSALSAQDPAARAAPKAADPRPALPAPALVAQEIEAGVLRTALDEERARTTALRRDLDAGRVTVEARDREVAALRAELAELAATLDTLRRHRDVWADRARGMAALLARDPDLADLDGRAAA